jgi:hypothetical protein
MQNVANGEKAERNNERNNCSKGNYRRRSTKTPTLKARTGQENGTRATAERSTKVDIAERRKQEKVGTWWTDNLRKATNERTDAIKPIK